MSMARWAVVPAAVAVLGFAAGDGLVAPAAGEQVSNVAREQANWGPVKVVGVYPWGQSMAIDARGDATVAWATGPPSRKILALRRPAGGTWRPQVAIGHGDDPQVVADERGNLTAAWLTQRRGYTDGVAVARRPAGGRWSHPVRLSHDVRVPGYPHGGEDPYGASDLELAASPRGAVVATWAWGSYDRRIPSRIQSAYRPAGGHWLEPVRVTPASDASQPKVGIDARGDVVLVYQRQPFGHPPALVSRRRVHGVGWTKPTTVAPEAYDPAVAVDRAGNAVVAFSPDFETVQVARRPAGGRWGAARTLSPRGVVVGDFSLAMSGRGKALVAMGRHNGRVDLAVRPPRGPWRAPVRLARRGAPLSDVVVATNGAGDTLLTWGCYALYGRYLPHGGTWSRTRTISPATRVDVLEDLYAVVGPRGDGGVLWAQEDKPLRVRLLHPSHAS